MVIKRKAFKGFTLLEILIVTVIISLLFALIPQQVVRAKERAARREAFAALKMMVGAQWAYRMNKGAFAPACTCNSLGAGAGGCENPVTGCNVILKLNLNPNNWNYKTFEVFAVGWITHVHIIAAAVRVNAGANNGCTYYGDNWFVEPYWQAGACS